MKLIILDRDGVINQDSDAYIKTLDEWIPIPGSIDAVARLSKAGWTIAVATNQSGIGRGYYSPDAGCDCRKPAPGLFRQVAHTLQTELAGVPTVGDSLRDLEAGVAVGCVPYLVRTGKGHSSQHKLLPEGTRVFDNLAAVVDHLLEA